MRGMHVDDNLRRKVVYLGKNDVRDAMRVVLGNENEEGCNTLARYQRNDWVAYLSKLFRATYGECEEVWLAAPADHRGKGGQIFRISFRRPISINTIVNSTMIGNHDGNRIQYHSNSNSSSSSSSTSDSSSLSDGTVPMSTHSVDDMTIEEFAPGSINLPAPGPLLPASTDHVEVDIEAEAEAATASVIIEDIDDDDEDSSGMQVS